MGALERLLVLGAGTGQLGLLAAAKARGLFVIAVDRDPTAPGFRHAHRRAIVSVEDEPALERLAEAARIDGVIAPGADWPVGPAARIAARLGLGHPVSAGMAARAARALGIREGPTVTRLLVGGGRPRVLELSARIGGGHEPELCQAAVGVDLHALALSAALGEPVSAKELRTKRCAGGACVRFLDGTCSPDGLVEAESLPGIEWVRVHGDTDRAGAVLATGGSPAEALERATQAAECIRFRPPHAQAV